MPRNPEDYNKLVDRIDDDELADGIADDCYSEIGPDCGEAIERYRNMLLRLINGETES